VTPVSGTLLGLAVMAVLVVKLDQSCVRIYDAIIMLMHVMSVFVLVYQTRMEKGGRSIMSVTVSAMVVGGLVNGEGYGRWEGRDAGVIQAKVGDIH
jgi:hypothetical protein